MGSTALPQGTDETPLATGSAGDARDAGPAAAPDTCTFDVQYALSPKIGTVGIVTFSTSLQGMTDASIEFGPVEEAGRTLSAPVDLAVADHRTLLLGMRSEQTYWFRIVAKAGDAECTSEDYTLETGPIPNAIPRVDVEVHQPGRVTEGFFVTSSGMGTGYGGGDAFVYIFDQDGEVVWWTEAPTACSRARMDFEGSRMWMLQVNYPEGEGSLGWTSMDGLAREDTVPGMESSNHDFTVAPGGIVTAMRWSGDCQAIVELSPDGTIDEIVSDTRSLYAPGFECHGNAITYQAFADTYVLSDREPNLFVRFDRTGKLLWQFGGDDPLPGATHLPGDWRVNHGHHLLPDGHFLFFNNNGPPNGQSPVLEFILDPSSGTAERVWSYESGRLSDFLGDVQRLPNGNTIVTYSAQSVFQEVDAAANPVATFTSTGVGTGYAIHRPTLYGAPPK